MLSAIVAASAACAALSIPTASMLRREFVLSPTTSMLRREFVLSTVGLLSAPHAALAVAGDITGDSSSRYCQTSSTPAATVVTCLGFGLDSNSRLHGCAADEACVASAAVNNPSKFSPPWAPMSTSREAKDGQRAWRALVSAVEDEPGLTIVERNDERLYLRATAPAAVPTDGTDDVEFRLLDEAGGPRALYRSATRQSVFVYPLQQPIPNQKTHAERLERIRVRLGWESLGLAGDGALEANMGFRQARNFFGLQLQGISVPEEYDD